MNYITQEDALKLYSAAEEEAPKLLGCVGEYHPDLWKVEHHLLCNAAIKHYLDAQQVKPVELNWAPVAQWWESGNEDWSTMQSAVLSMIEAAQERT